MLSALTLILVLTATFRPEHPHVGDPIVIDFPEPVALDASPHYEVLSQTGRRTIVRTFEPRPFALSGRSGSVAFRNLVVPVQSVLKSKDDLRPAPLAPPVVTPYPAVATQLLFGVAGLAVLAWLSVVLLARRVSAAANPVPSIPPDERFRAAVIALRNNPRRPQRWAELADATRAFLAATDPDLGVELTTTEVRPLLELKSQRRRPVGSWPAHGDATVIEILRQGDLEKFSPWGARPADFAELAHKALQLAPEPLPESEVAA